MNKNKRKKSITKYILLTILYATLGAIGGNTAFKLKNSSFRISDEFILKQIPIIIIFIIAAILIFGIIVSAKLYFDAKQIIKKVNEEDEELYKKADEKISMSLSIMTLCMCLGFIMIAMIFPIVFSGANMATDNIGKISILIALLLFIIFIAYEVPMTVKCVEQTKILYPEKKGYALDKSFEKDWLNSMDEAEKQLVGEASYYTYKIMSKMYPYIMLIGVLLCLFIPMAYIFVILIGCLWCVHVGTYLKKTMESEFKKKKGNL